jgi:hypothetical protein
MGIKIVVTSVAIAAAGVAGSVQPTAATATGHVFAARAAARPTVTGLHVTKRTAHALSFAATVNPKGLATKAKLLAKYHRRTVGGATRSAGSGNGATTLHFTITHLHAHRTFRIQVSATSSAGTTVSAVIRAATRALQ